MYTATAARIASRNTTVETVVTAVSGKLPT